MDKAGAKKFYKTSMAYVKINYPDELKWVKGVTSRTFDRMTFQEFLGEYCWVVFAANFKVKTVEKHFPAIKRAFHNFSPKNVCDMKSPGPDFPIKNKLKANSFLKGAKQIQAEGFDRFKARVKGAGDEGMDVLSYLPFIKEITKKHLARNVGIKSVAKNDIWLVRLVKKFNATDVDQMVAFLSKEFGHRQGVVDLVLWQFCADCGCG